MLALVVKRFNYRENDQIISLLTETGEKINVLARGVKKIISKNSAYLEPFFLIEVEIISGKEISHLIKASPVKSFRKIREDFFRLILAQKAMIILNYIIPERASEKSLFIFAVWWLENLEKAEKIYQSFLIGFLLRSLKILGYQPILNKCFSCNQEIRNVKTNFNFKIEDGGIQCSLCNQTISKTFLLNNLERKSWLSYYEENNFKNWPKKNTQNLLQIIILFSEYCTGRNLKFLQ